MPDPSSHKNTDQQSLLILTPGFANDETDTSCLTSQQNLVKSINKLIPALEVIVIAFQYPYRTQPYQWYGNSVIPLNGQNKGGLRRRWTWIKAYRQLKKLQQQKNIVGILSFWCGECAMLGNRFAEKNKLKHYCWVLGQDAKPGNKYAARFRSFPHQLVPISDFVAEQLKRNYNIQPARVIANGIEPAQFPVVQPIKDIDIIAVGSLIPLKQFDVVIDIVNGLRKEKPDLKAMICGDGPEKEMLHKKILSFDLENNIELAGAQKHATVLQLLQRSRVLLHPSAYEGFPTVCLEALQAGCKVISFIEPMQNAIDNWEIAVDLEDMKRRTWVNLNAPVNLLPFTHPYNMDKSAATFMQLFGFNL